MRIQEFPRSPYGYTFFMKVSWPYSISSNYTIIIIIIYWINVFESIYSPHYCIVKQDCEQANLLNNSHNNQLLLR